MRYYILSLFITFEGGEGGGKSTQVILLRDFLIQKGYSVITTREPGGTPIAEKIRLLLLDTKNNKMVSRTELFLYIASRAQHTVELIRPALQEGKVVISDRFADASVVYQGAGRKLPPETIELLNDIATENLKPNLTIILDIPSEIGLNRILQNSSEYDRIEQEKLEFHKRVREGYQRLAKLEPKRVKIIDALLSIEEIHKQIQQLVIPLLF